MRLQPSFEDAERFRLILDAWIPCNRCWRCIRIGESRLVCEFGDVRPARGSENDPAWLHGVTKMLTRHWAVKMAATPAVLLGMAFAVACGSPAAAPAKPADKTEPVAKAPTSAPAAPAKDAPAKDAPAAAVKPSVSR